MEVGKGNVGGSALATPSSQQRARLDGGGAEGGGWHLLFASGALFRNSDIADGELRSEVRDCSQWRPLSSSLVCEGTLSPFPWASHYITEK